MAVITISRQHGSGGRAVTKLLCDRLSYRYFDKDLMAQLGAQIGLAPDQVVDLPEASTRCRASWSGCSATHRPPSAIPASGPCKPGSMPSRKYLHPYYSWPAMAQVQLRSRDYVQS
jgi:hypothetical protein